MKTKKRGQLAIEYLIIVGFSFLMVAGILIVFSIQNTNQNYSVVDSQIDTIANRIAQSVEEVFYLGEPSRKTITFYMPSNIDEVLIFDNEILFKAKLSGGLSDFYYPLKVQVEGNISTSEGIKHVLIIAQSSKVCIVEEGMNPCIN
jgi:uncharacterized protein (UPF0333 family)